MAFFFEIIGGPIATYLLPVTPTKFESLDGSVKIEFVMDGEMCSGMNIAAFGYDLTSNKIK